MTISSAKTSRILPLAALGSGLVLLASLAAAQQPMPDHAAHMAMAEHAAMSMSDDHDLVVDFDLVDRDGNAVSDEDFRGRYVLLGFGFTHCEHICPLMALNMSRVVAGAVKPATGIFVSVDTERDTAAISDDYASHFGESMMGLGGTLEQINAAVKNFKVSYAVTKTQDNYTVQHTANMFLIGPDGELVDVFSFATAPSEILEAIR